MGKHVEIANRTPSATSPNLGKELHNNDIHPNNHTLQTLLLK